MKPLKISNKNLTIENCPNSTYWLNKKTGTIVYLCIDTIDRDKVSKLTVYTTNTERERSYEYTWDELVSKFLCIRNENITNDQYDNVINNVSLSSWYKFATKKLPRLEKNIKNFNKKEKAMFLPLVKELTFKINQFENCFTTREDHVVIVTKKEMKFLEQISESDFSGDGNSLNDYITDFDYNMKSVRGLIPSLIDKGIIDYEDKCGVDDCYGREMAWAEIKPEYSDMENLKLINIKVA